MHSLEFFPVHPCFRWVNLPFHAVASPVQFCTGMGCLLGLLQGSLRGFEFWGGVFLFVFGFVCYVSVLLLSEYCLSTPVVQEEFSVPFQVL